MRFSAPGLLVAAACLPITSLCQVLPDPSLATTVSRAGHSITIAGGTRAGANLFHGFMQFDVGRGDIATFTSPAAVERIIGRVTGSTPSQVEGRLVASASLYLVNPRGWIFGPDASLDVQGVFGVSSADYIALGTSGRFDASQPERTVLSSAAPSAFGFLGPSAAPIVVNGSQLAARPGGRLWLSGGELRLAGARLTAPGGRIDLEALGTIDATSSLIAADSSGTGLASGAISIRASRFVLTNGASVQSVNESGSPGEAIHVQASGEVLLDDATMSTRTGPGAGGGLTIEAESVALANGAQIDTATFGAGAGGALSITASDSVRINGQGSGLLSFALAGGDAGTIRLRAASLEMDRGAISARTYAAGNAGAVDIAVGRMSLVNAAQIDATTLGHGQGGDLNVSASQEIVISGRDPARTEIRSGLFASAEFDALLTTGPADGAGGTIRVKTPSLVLRDYGFISSGTFAPAIGAGGSVVVDAGRIALESGGEIGSTSKGIGDAGTLRISAGSSLSMRGGIISTQADSADGGNIVIAARDLLYLKDSDITTSVGTGEGNGGNITIDPQFVVLDNSRIIANAFGGNGGNIAITASNFLTQSSIVEASSALGISGEVRIEAPRVDVSSALGGLNASYLDASRLIRASCASRAHQGSSTLVPSGRGGMAKAPDESGQQLRYGASVALGCGVLQGMPAILDHPAAGDHHIVH